MTPRLATGLAMAASCIAALAAPAEEKLIDGIAAQVDGRIVLVSDVLRSVRPQERAMREAGAPPQAIAQLRADGLERLIEAKLIEGLVERTELYASDEEIDRTIAGIAEENGLSVEQLHASVVFHGLSVEAYRARIKGDFERRNLVNAMVGPQVKVEETEVRALFESRFAGQASQGEAVRVRQILVAYGEASGRGREQACDTVRDAERRVAAGEAFELVASEVSEVAPRDGGDIGWLPLESAATWMREALEGLDAGDTSDLLVLPFGCSLLQLVERRELEPVSYEQAKPVLERELFERKLDREYRRWMEELRGRSYIERRGHFADAASFGEPTFPVAGGGAEPEDAAGP